jgi:hypothetical protein
MLRSCGNCSCGLVRCEQDKDGMKDDERVVCHICQDCLPSSLSSLSSLIQGAKSWSTSHPIKMPPSVREKCNTRVEPIAKSPSLHCMPACFLASRGD